MKKLLYILFISGAITSMFGCNKFLELEVENRFTDTLIKSEKELQELINGSYRNYSTNVYNGKIQWIQDLLADQAIGTLFTGDDGEIWNRKTSIFGDYKNGLYNDLYSIINNVNIAYEYIDLASASSRNQIEGQIKFVRALAHFNVLNLWAQPWGYTANNTHHGIVLVDKPTLEPGQRKSVAESYTFIINDLLSAIDLLDETTDTYFANKNAAKALLARVYFMQNNFEGAFQYANQVIESGDYSLDSDYESKFSLDASSEIIFGYPTLQQNMEPGGELRNRYRSDINFSPQGKFYFGNNLYNAINQNGDRRGAAWTSNSLVEGMNVLTKYNNDFFDVPVLGLTEMKLIRAESGAQLGGANLAIAIDDINDIMERAYGGTSMNLASNTPAATVINAVRRERQFETIGEGDRLMEIKRIGALTNVSIDGRGAPWNCPGLVLQFPSGEKAGYTDFINNPEGGCN